MFYLQKRAPCKTKYEARDPEGPSVRHTLSTTTTITTTRKMTRTSTMMRPPQQTQQELQQVQQQELRKWMMAEGLASPSRTSTHQQQQQGVMMSTSSSSAPHTVNLDEHTPRDVRMLFPCSAPSRPSSKRIPINMTEPTDFEQQLGQKEAEAEYRDYLMYQRILGASKEHAQRLKVLHREMDDNNNNNAHMNVVVTVKKDIGPSNAWSGQLPLPQLQQPLTALYVHHHHHHQYPTTTSSFRGPETQEGNYGSECDGDDEGIFELEL